jgi:FkbM family methyltransferase
MSVSVDFGFLEMRIVLEQRDKVVSTILAAARVKRLAIIGSAALPQRCAAAIRAAGVEIPCFVEYDPRYWGQVIADTPIVSPNQAARMIGPQGVVIAGVWSPHHSFAATAAWAQLFGLNHSYPAAAVFWAFPELIGAHYQLGPPDVYADARDRIEQLSAQLADPLSRKLLREHVRWRVTLDPSGLPAPDRTHVYFNHDLFELGDDATAVDCGAFDGDSLRSFLRYQGDSFRAFHALEPDPVSFGKLESYVGSLPQQVASRVHLHQAAAGATNGSIQISATGMPGSQHDALQDGGVQVSCTRLDSLLGDRKVDHLKLDIEGAEWEALEGAAGLISRERPVIAAAIYHKPLDIVDLPLKLIQHMQDQVLFLRSHDDDGIDLVAYCVPRERRLRR